MSSDKQDPKKEELTLAINEIQSTPAVATCTSATFSFDANELFKKMTETPQIMARVSAYDANEPDKNPIKKADIERIKRVFGF
jgi:hypothetical protein